MANTTSSIRFIDETHAQVTKAFSKKASYFGTPEFKLWREYLEAFPGAQMVTKSIKRNPDKRTNRNMTYANMAAYISEQDDAVALMDEFQKRVRMSKVQANPYRYVVAWFMVTFENYENGYQDFFDNLAKKAEEESSIYHLSAVSKPQVVVDDMDAASNF